MVIVRFNRVRDEFTLRADDSDDAPEEPMLLTGGLKMIFNHVFSLTKNTVPDPMK